MQKFPGQAMSLGSVMIGIEGLSLTDQDRKRLLHPLVAGVILFARNFESPEQLQALTSEIHALRHPKLLIGVDHEGGRVQRFKQGFTHLPPARTLGQKFDENAKHGLILAEQMGWLLATELLSVGVDFSFTPVLDLDYGCSSVIGDRALHADPQVVAKLGFALMKGMRQAGMPAVSKHFPGHGYIQADTHFEVAVDQRPFEQLWQWDLQPFLTFFENGGEAVMPAHVVYPQVDDLPADFSPRWLQQILRQRCHFDGCIVSDDLGMAAAKTIGSASERTLRALQAGCDLVLLCNEFEEIDQALQEVNFHADPLSHARLIRMHGHAQIPYAKLFYHPLWQAAHQKITALAAKTEQQELL